MLMLQREVFFDERSVRPQPVLVSFRGFGDPHSFSVLEAGRVGAEEILSVLLTDGTRGDLFSWQLDSIRQAEGAYLAQPFARSTASSQPA